MVFFLLFKKYTAVYKKALSQLLSHLSGLENNNTLIKEKPASENEVQGLKKNMVDSEPYHKLVLSDFEEAEHNAFREVFKSKTIGCFFHFRKAINKRIRKFKSLRWLY